MFRSLATSLASAVALAAFVGAPVLVAGQAQTTVPKRPPVVSGGGAATALGRVAPKRLPWGDPDISGNFTTKDEMNTPFERPDEFAGKRIEDISPEQLAEIVKARQRRALSNAPFPGGGDPSRGVAIAVPIHWFDSLDSMNSRPWFVIDPPDGRIPPLTEEAKKRAADRAAYRATRGTADSFTDRSLSDRCITRGVPQMTQGLYGASYQILQTKDYVAIRYEMIHVTRIIPIEGRGAARPHVSEKIRPDVGDAIARWDGNTLVIDTTNFSPRTNYRGASQHLHMVERFTRTAPDKVEWTVTMEDPHTWARPWTYSIPLTEDDAQPIHEYACHEGNYGLRNILSAGRSDDRKGIKSSDSVAEQADLEE